MNILKENYVHHTIHIGTKHKHVAQVCIDIHLLGLQMSLTTGVVDRILWFMLHCVAILGEHYIIFFNVMQCFTLKNLFKF